MPLVVATCTTGCEYYWSNKVYSGFQFHSILPCCIREGYKLHICICSMEDSEVRCTYVIYTWRSPYMYLKVKRVDVNFAVSEWYFTAVFLWLWMQGRVNYDPDSSSKVKFCIFQGFWLLYTGENDLSCDQPAAYVTNAGQWWTGSYKDHAWAAQIRTNSCITLLKPLCPSQNATQIDSYMYFRLQLYSILKSDWSGTWRLLPIDTTYCGFYCVRGLRRVGTAVGCGLGGAKLRAEPFDYLHALESLIRFLSVLVVVE